MRQFNICIFIVLFIVACASKEKEYQKPKKEIQTEQTKTTAKSNQNSTESNTATSASDPVPKEQLKKAKKIIKGMSDESIAAIDAKAKFKMLCATCHGFDGNMMINGAKDLTKSTIDLTESVAQVYFGKGLMTPFNGIMTDEEIVAVAKYCETLRK